MRQNFTQWLLVGFLLCQLCSCASNTELATSAQKREEDVYRINVGDKMKINVWRVAELTLEAKVNRDGTLGYPLLGDLPVEGKTAKEVEQSIKDGLSKGYVENPLVTVTVIQGSWRYFITGEVKTSGSFPLEEDINVYQAIIRAGGFTDFASRTVKIIRYERGRRRVINVNVNRYHDPGEDIKEGRVVPGDTIIVTRSLL